MRKILTISLSEKDYDYIIEKTSMYNRSTFCRCAIMEYINNLSREDKESCHTREDEENN